MVVCELEGIELDYLVAKHAGMLRMISGTKEEQLGNYSPSTNWQHGGPIIERERICVAWENGKPWAAVYEPFCIVRRQIADTPLVAAMRAYVDFKARKAQEAMSSNV